MTWGRKEKLTFGARLFLSARYYVDTFALNLHNTAEGVIIFGLQSLIR